MGGRDGFVCGQKATLLDVPITVLVGCLVNALGAPVDSLGGIEADGLNTRRLESSSIF